MTRASARLAVATLYVAGLTLVGLTTYLARPPVPSSSTARPPRPVPSLYCDFFDFTRARVVVSFDFAVERDAGRLDFLQRAVVEPDGTRNAFDAPERPRWAPNVDEGTMAIASPSDETRIILYGLQPEKGGVFWIEAGLRSNRYRNLEGKCRQAYLGGARLDKGDKS